MTHALYHLAAVPEWIKALREEIEPIVSAEGWSKASMGKMWKLDSLFRESQRRNGIAVGAFYYSCVFAFKGVKCDLPSSVRSEEGTQGHYTG